MNILITGATGFIGRNLTPFLIKEGHNIHALIRPTTKPDFLFTDKVVVFEDDIPALADYLKSNRIDGIIHLATLYLNTHRPEQIAELVKSNVYLGTAILEAAVAANVKWFLNTGTIWQNFNAPAYSKQYCPVNLYAASKQAFVDMAKYYVEMSDIRFATLKLCDTYGENDTRKKIYSLFEQIAKTGETLDMSPGEQKMDLVHISKVLDSFLKLTELLHSDDEFEDEYVVSSGQHRTLKEIAEQYEIAHNVKLNINWGGKPYRDREVMEPYIGKEI